MVPRKQHPQSRIEVAAGEEKAAVIGFILDVSVVGVRLRVEVQAVLLTMRGNQADVPLIMDSLTSHFG